ncbi:RNA-binding protein [Marinilabiliaceae bacterium JC017]|nr:RNA-binding protein [Marinilabiliaceae bacterium JC017]
MNIFVAKLSSRTTSEDLQQVFGEYGEVSSAKVIMDRETGYSKKFGFVEMDDEQAGLNAIEQLNDSEIDGSRIVVKKARPRTENQGGGGRGGFRPRNNRY